MDGPGSVGDILAFVETVRASGFAAAARRLGRSRSAVAKAVARLEARLGARLMTRSTRRLALTEDGRRFFASASDLLDALAAAEAEVAQGALVPRGLLRLAAPDAYGRALILPAVAEYLAANAAVRVELHLSDRVDHLVEQGWDVAIRIGLPDALPPDLVARVIDRIEHGFYAAPAYLERRGRPEDLASLADHEAIPYDAGDRHGRWRMLAPNGTWADLPCASRISVDSADGVLAAARLGLGLAYLPRLVVTPALAAGELIEVLMKVPGGDLPVVALFASRRNLPARVRAFLDLLAA